MKFHLFYIRNNLHTASKTSTFNQMLSQIVFKNIEFE